MSDTVERVKIETDKAAVEVAGLATDAVTLPAATPGGWRGPMRFREVLGSGQFEGLTFEVQSNITGMEQRFCEAITRFDDLAAFLAPRIRSWNIEGARIAHDELPANVDGDGNVTMPARTVDRLVYEILPAPIDAGPDVFQSVDIMTMIWIRYHLLVGYQTPRDPKPLPPSGPTPDGTRDGGDQSPKDKPRRPRR